jgi:FlaA1/EpsC-like NDP-sugar epimerase
MIANILDSRLFDNKSLLITGGTGSLGKELVSQLLEHAAPRRVVVFSRDEYKQFVMAEKFRRRGQALRFFLGDVRHKHRLRRAFDGVDYVIHAAALRQVPAAEYNPSSSSRRMSWAPRTLSTPPSIRASREWPH